MHVINTGTDFAIVIGAHLPDPEAGFQLRPGQTVETARAARREATAKTIHRVYGPDRLPASQYALRIAYLLASERVVLPPVGSPAYVSVAVRAETARQIADLLKGAPPFLDAEEHDAQLREVADFWRRRADRIEAAKDPTYPSAQTAAVVAVLRREADAVVPEVVPE